MRRLILCTLLSLLSAGAALAQIELERGFQSPPPECRPSAFMTWMGGMVSRDGLTKDFESLAREGVGGVLFGVAPDQLAGVLQWPYRDYPGKLKGMDKEWFAMMNHAIGEADRLGLDAYVFPCAGWSHVGGPWVNPEKSLKVLVGGVTSLKGPSHFQGMIPRAPAHVENRPTLAPWASDAEDWKKLKSSFGDYYRDVAVFAWPAGAGTAQRPLPRERMLDLSGKMDAQGRLTWDVPEGIWTVMRLGLAAYNGINYPAPLEGTGLECDRMDPAAVPLVLENFLGRIAREARAKGYKALKGFDTDSYEAGFQDFSPDFPDEFKKRMGYDCTPWLPAWLDKKLVVGNPDLTARFQRDMLRVISDLWLERFYAAIRRYAEANGLQWLIEPYFMLNFDWRTVASKAHVPGSEFWVKEKIGNTFGDLLTRDLIGPAPDTAALYGRNVVWAEAFTASPDNSAWRNDPWLLKPYGDAAYCRGVNHFFLCGFVHNPFGEELQPGLSAGYWGTQFSRHVTWWPYASAWTRYLARCQFMLRQGVPVADVLAYPPRTEHVPSPVLDCLPYKQNVSNDEILLERLSVKDGRLVLAHGVSYAALALTPTKPNTPPIRMTPQALRRIRDLVREGATLIGAPVEAHSVSMQNFPQCDKEMAGLVAEIWGTGAVTGQGERRVGKGRVSWGRPLVEALDDAAGGPDFEFAGLSGGPVAPSQRPRYDFFHRSTAQAEIYFVANLHDEAIERTASFRVSGRQPQLWDAVTGQIRPLPQYQEVKGHTLIPLSLAARQSVFIIFPHTEKDRAADKKPGSQRQNFPEAIPVCELKGPWDVAFDPKWGGPKQIEFATLEDWSKRPEEGIKYYSGTATYRKTFDLDQSAILKPQAAIYLDLGKVKNLARVRLNGRDLGIVWCAPWRVALGKPLQTRGNRLEIEVVNTWVNRLIGDEQIPADAEYVKVDQDQKQGGYKQGVDGLGLKDLPDWLITGKPRPSKRHTFSNWLFYPKNAPLMESGLLGPVRIVVEP